MLKTAMASREAEHTAMMEVSDSLEQRAARRPRKPRRPRRPPTARHAPRTTSPPHHLATSPPHHLATSPPHHLTTSSLYLAAPRRARHCQIVRAESVAIEGDVLIREVRLRSTPAKEHEDDGRHSANANVSDISLSGSLANDNESVAGGGRRGVGRGRRSGDGDVDADGVGDEDESVDDESDWDGDMIDGIADGLGAGAGAGAGNSDDATVVAEGSGSGRDVQVHAHVRDREREIELEGRLAELEQRYTEQRSTHEAALAALAAKHAVAMGKLSFLLRDGVMERLEHALAETEVRLGAGARRGSRVRVSWCRTSRTHKPTDLRTYELTDSPTHLHLNIHMTFVPCVESLTF